MNLRVRFRVMLPALFLTAVCLFAAAATMVSAATAPARIVTEDEVREVARELTCLECQGLSAWESNSRSSLQIREEIRAQLAEGKSKAEILEDFVERYGEAILMAPPVKGRHFIAYLLPAAAVLVGGLSLAGYFRKGRRAWDPSGAHPPRQAAEDEAEKQASVGEAEEAEIERLLQRLRSPDPYA